MRQAALWFFATMMQAHEFLHRVYVPARVDLTDGAVHQLDIAVRLFSRFLGRPAELPDLSAESVCAFMRWLLKLGRSPRTVNGRRDSLLTLRRFAAKRGLLPPLQDEVPAAKEPRRRNSSWSNEEFCSLVKGCSGERDGAILRAVLLVAWDTSCRIGAIMKTPRSAFDPERRLLSIYEAKVRTEVTHRLSEATVQALLALSPRDGSLFGWTKSLYILNERLTALQRRLGLPCGRRDKWHKIRRTKYTLVYVQFGPRAASLHAGHSTDMSRSYLDDSRLATAELVDAIPPPV